MKVLPRQVKRGPLMTMAAPKENEGEFIYLPLLHIMSPPCAHKHIRTQTYGTQDSVPALFTLNLLEQQNNLKKTPSGLLTSEPMTMWDNKAGRNHTTVCGEAEIDCRL